MTFKSGELTKLLKITFLSERERKRILTMTAEWPLSDRYSDFQMEVSKNLHISGNLRSVCKKIHSVKPNRILWRQKPSVLWIDSDLVIFLDVIQVMWGFYSKNCARIALVSLNKSRFIPSGWFLAFCEFLNVNHKKLSRNWSLFNLTQWFFYKNCAQLIHKFLSHSLAINSSSAPSTEFYFKMLDRDLRGAFYLNIIELPKWFSAY